MRIGGTTRDRMMTLIPAAVAIFVATLLIGGPGDGLRVLEQAASDVWSALVLFFRR
jgi:hypothetical protein